jgi:hypothetical protein
LCKCGIPPTCVETAWIHARENHELEHAVELSLTVGKKREGGMDTGRLIPVHTG